MDGTVIVADDDRAIRTVLSQALTRAGCRVRSTATVGTLWQWIEAGEGDAVVTDVMMPDGDALDMLPAIRRKRPDLPVIVMSAQNTVMTAVRATEAGAFEYFPKPFDLRELLRHVSKALAGTSGPEEPRSDGTTGTDHNLPLVGGSPAMQEVYRIIARLMNTDLAVLISGQSGTGKELVARSLHNFGNRSDKEFVGVNFGAMAAGDIDAAFFGSTGSGGPVSGRLEHAHGGTLFLDEVGDMPLEAQQRLLRIMQEGRFRPAGGLADQPLDVRIIAATHRDLRELVTEGRFREDLFYRLNVVPVRLPPLAERLEDIPELARHFLRAAQNDGLPAKSLSKPAIDLLKKQRWPGNVRELENFMHRLMVLSPGDVIEPGIVEQEITRRPSSAELPGREEGQTLSASVQAHLQRHFDLHGQDLPSPGLYHRVLREVELPLFALSLAATGGNQIKAAELLGINRNTLRKKIRELDINVTRGRKLM